MRHFAELSQCSMWRSACRKKQGKCSWLIFKFRRCRNRSISDADYVSSLQHEITDQVIMSQTFIYRHINSRNLMIPRIKPLDQPKGLFNMIMYRKLKRTFGKVILPAKVIYARYPEIGLLVKRIHAVEHSLPLLSKEEKLLIHALVAVTNGCQFCMDLSKRKALNTGTNLQRLIHLSDFEGNEIYSPREKAILSFVEDMTKNITVTDEIYQRIKKYCSDDEVIEITYTAAAENFLNRILKPLQIGSDELCALN